MNKNKSKDIDAFVKRSAENRKREISQEDLGKVQEACMLGNIEEKELFYTNDEQFREAIKIGKRMLESEIPYKDVIKFLVLARIYEGAFDLMQLWDSEDEKYKKEIVSDLMGDSAEDIILIDDAKTYKFSDNLNFGEFDAIKKMKASDAPFLISLDMSTGKEVMGEKMYHEAVKKGRGCAGEIKAKRGIDSKKGTCD